MFRLSPALRITLGILGLTLGLLMAADFLGFIGDSKEEALQQRQRFAEMVTLQLSIAIENKSDIALQSLLWTLVQRNDQVVGAVVRRRDGAILASKGEFDREWHPDAENTETHMSLPIAVGPKRIGTVELNFKPIAEPRPLGLPLGGIIGLSAFVVLFGGVSYWLFLRRSLLYLDPSSVVPARVRRALNVLNNGVLILDDKGQIVLVNDSFSRKLGFSADELIGGNPSEFPWVIPEKYAGDFVFPWAETLAKGIEKSGAQLTLEDRDKKQIVFLVNSSPIVDADGKQRGVIVGMDDVTDLKSKNRLLKTMVNELEASKRQVEEQNVRLHIMATRDPLTNCHNRRSMYDTLESALQTARDNGQSLTCIMSDIDHFKSVNDTHGHAAGDEVIKMVASVLIEEVGEKDIVCRYGGEEFCIMLMGAGLFDAKKLAERCRQKVAAKITSGIKVTSSFGISTLSYGAATVDELIHQADEALYMSKHRGRNCVSVWEKNRAQGGGENIRAVEPG